MQGLNIVTIVLIAINVLLSMKGFSDRVFFNKYKFQISPIQQGDKLRLFSSGFLHVDQAHLFMNMLTLYFFANPVINRVREFNFVLIYLASLLAGSLLAMLFHKNEPYYSAVGASGAVSGILYASILLNPGMSLYLYFAIKIPGFVFAIGYLLYSMYGMKKSLGNIGHSAHLGGAIGGYVLTILLHPSIIQTNKNLVIVLAIPIVLMFVFKDKLLNK
ncbi:MAG: rhomboid family intramembrane serine protease [Flavobacteriaceae bacterium]